MITNKAREVVRKPISVNKHGWDESGGIESKIIAISYIINKMFQINSFDWSLKIAITFPLKILV